MAWMCKSTRIIQTTRIEQAAHMLVDVAKLFEAMKRLAWRHGMVRPELLRHVVNPDGSHTITLHLDARDVEYTPPKHLERPSWGASTPEGTDGKQR
jgi:hypothetical protein